MTVIEPVPMQEETGADETFPGFVTYVTKHEPPRKMGRLISGGATQWLAKVTELQHNLKKIIHCTYKVTHAYWCNHCRPGKAMSSSSSSSSSSSTRSYHGVGPLVHPFRSHTSPCPFYGLPSFLLPVRLHFFFILGNLLRGILFVCCNQFPLYSCILSKSGVIFCSFAISLSLSLFFNNQSQCILLFFSYISYLLLLFFLRLLL